MSEWHSVNTEFDDMNNGHKLVYADNLPKEIRGEIKMWQSKIILHHKDLTDSDELIRLQAIRFFKSQDFINICDMIGLNYKKFRGLK